MPIDVSEPQSPGWWLHRASRKLVSRQSRLDDLISRFEGDSPLPHVNASIGDAYRSFQKKSRTNWPENIVEAVRERMTLTGIRTAVEEGESGDLTAWEIAEESGLAVELSDVLQMMLSAGDGYMIVGKDAVTQRPVITGEDPRQVVTIHDPVQQRKVRAALKMFHDRDEERDYAYLYRPGRVHVAFRDIKRPAKTGPIFNTRTWDWDDTKGGADGQALDDPDMLPVVRFRNRRGVGEFELHRDLLDRIDHMVLMRLVIATFQAFRQRAVKGLPDEDDEGNEIEWKDVFTADPGALWQLPQGVEFWESENFDLRPLLEGEKEDLRSLAAVTRTALSYLAPDMAAQSAEGASLMREAQIFRTEDRIARANESVKDVMSYAFTIAGDVKRADRSKLKPMWSSPERLTLAARGDAATKAEDLPARERLIHIWGFSPDEADRMMKERAEDAFADFGRGQ